MMKCRKISLDELQLGNVPHADYLLVKGNEVIIIEETGTAEIRDIEKMEQTIELMRQGRIQGIGKDPPRQIKAVLHARGRVPSLVAKVLRDKSSPDHPYYIVKCHDGIRRYTGCY